MSRGGVSPSEGMSRAQVAAVIAIDWSDAKQDSGRLDMSPSTTTSCLLMHTPDALEAWATALRTRVAGPTRAVGLEPSRGPRSSALLTHDVRGLSPINPATRATYREAFSPRRAQDEPREAADRLAWRLPPRDRLKAWRPAKAKTRTRHYLGEHSRRLVNDRTRLSPRMTARLTAYFPQV
jgi:hypothetical protein